MVRTVVFPALRLVVWTVIAVSLAWLAFGDPDPTPPTTATPTFEVTTPEVSVTRGSVENKVSMPGSITADPAVPVKTTADGRVSRLRARVGDQVAKGAPLLDVVTETQAEAQAGTPARSARSAQSAESVQQAEAPTQQPSAPAPATKRTTTVIRAASAGTVTAVDVLVNQQVAVGDTVASLSPGTLTVTASLSQEQQFRLLSAPTEADVSVPGGPAPFRCTNVRIGQPAGDQPPATPANPYEPSAVSGPVTGSLTCRVPPDATVFAGMSATVELLAGAATDVLVLPVSAVQGSVSTGVVWLLGQGGEPVETSVELGLTDGEQVEIRVGLAEGDRVLQFVPDSDEPAGGPGGPGGPGAPIRVGPG